jgi:hypothetical protein
METGTKEGKGNGNKEKVAVKRYGRSKRRGLKRKCKAGWYEAGKGREREKGGKNTGNYWEHRGASNSNIRVNPESDLKSEGMRCMKQRRLECFTCMARLSRWVQLKQ